MALMVAIGSVVPGCLILNGCSGASHLFLSNSRESHRARAKVTIVWPERKSTRLIPVASNALKVTIQGINGFTVTQVISRPVTAAVFTNLPPGALTIIATAHADTFGAVEPAQAYGAQVVNALPDEQFQLGLTLGSTIDRVELTTAKATLDIGTTVTCAVTAKNAAGLVVLTNASTWSWSTVNGAVATVIGTGLTAVVTGVAAGTTGVVVRENESTKSVTSQITIVDPLAGVKEYLNIDLNAVPNYAAPNYPVHYDNVVLAQDNTPGNNRVSDKGALLGRVLFYDQRLSFNDTVSCASCHAPTNGFVDNARFSRGYEGGFTTAHAMRLGNIRFYAGRSMFWDKRSTSVENQSTQPIQNDIEMGFHGGQGGLQALLTKLAASSYYPELFKWAYGDASITELRIQNALSQFERSMVSLNSAFDTGFASVFNVAQPGAGIGNRFANYTAQEERGKVLFTTAPNQGGAGCVTCHTVPTFALDANSRSNGLDAGETVVFKSPSLKNVGLTGPYMHDGRFATLSAVVAHYNSGVQNGPALDNRLKTPQGTPLRLNLQQGDQDALVAFLKTLNDPILSNDQKFLNPFKK